MTDKIALDFVTICQQLKSCSLPDVDRVVGIGTGGVVLAALVAYELARPLTILPINYRAPDNTPRHARPLLLHDIDLPSTDRRLLLVDDVTVTGQTLALAAQTLASFHIITLVLKGRADIVLFPEIETCVQWPWQVVTDLQLATRNLQPESP